MRWLSTGCSYVIFGVLFSEAWIRVRDRVHYWLEDHAPLDQGVDLDELDRPTKGTGEL